MRTLQENVFSLIAMNNKMLMFRNTDKAYSTFCISTFYTWNTLNQKIPLNDLELWDMLAFLHPLSRTGFWKDLFLLVKQLCHLLIREWQQETAACLITSNETIQQGLGLFAAAISLTHVQSYLTQKVKKKPKSTCMHTKRVKKRGGQGMGTSC